jgi:hypothetical protein
MRLVIVDDCSYEKYNQIRNSLFKNIPFAIINAEFCNEKGYFFFWDGDYIPEELEKQMKIKGNKALVEKCNDELKEIL